MNKNKSIVSLILFHLFSIFSLYDWIRFGTVNSLAIILSFASLFYFVSTLDYPSNEKKDSV